MGTSGAYSGSGGKDGKAVRDTISKHLDGLGTADTAPLNPNSLRPVINLIRPRSTPSGGGDGPGGGGGGSSSTQSRSGGGPQRTAAASARTAGRAAAAAYAYRTGDATTLARLGLSYDELRSLGDEFEVLRRIVTMACAVPDSTIEDHEQRLVAAEVAEWVLEQEREGAPPTPEEIVRQTIATIIAETLLVESGDLVNNHDEADVAEKDIRDAAEAMAAQAPLSVDGATENEISRAVEAGLDTIRSILGGDD